MKRFFCLVMAVYGALYTAGQGFMMKLPNGHQQDATCGAFTPDGKRFISGSADHTIKIWDVASRYIVATLSGHQGPVRSVQVSPDGTQLLSASDDGTARLWSLERGTPISIMKAGAGKDGVMMAAFADRGRKVVTLVAGHGIQLWNAGNATEVSLKGAEQPLQQALVSPDGSMLVGYFAGTSAGRPASRVLGWKAGSGQLLFHLEDTVAIRCGTFSPDSKAFFTAANGIIQERNAGSGKITRKYYIIKYIDELAISPQGDKILTYTTAGHGYHYMDVVDRKSGVVLYQTATGNDINYAGFCDNGHGLFLSDGEQVRVYNDSFRVSRHINNRYINNPNESSAYNVNPFSQVVVDDERSIAYLLRKDGDINTYSLRSGQTAVMKGAVQSVQGALYSPDGKTILTMGKEATWVWDAANLTLKKKLDKSFRFRAFTRDSGFALTRFKSINHYDLQSGEQTFQSNAPFAPIDGLIYSPDKTRLLVYTNSSEEYVDGTAVTREVPYMMLCDSSSIGIMASWVPYKAPLSAVSFSPDGQKILTASENGGVKIFELRENHETVNPYDSRAMDAYEPYKIWCLVDLTYKDPVKAASFGKDAYTFLTLSGGEVTLVDWSTNPIHRKTLVSDTSIHAAQFARNATRVLVAAAHRLWMFDAATGALIFDHQVPGTLQGAPEVSPDGKAVAYRSGRGVVILNANDGKKFLELEGHDDDVNDLAYSPDGARILTTSNDNTARLWNAKTGLLVATLVAVGDRDFIIREREGAYYATPRAAKGIRFQDADGQLNTFDQLDLQYNRPDKVLEAIGCSDTALILSYRLAYRKRLRRLGIDTTTFFRNTGGGDEMPQADFADRSAIAYARQDGVLRIRVTGQGGAHALDRWNLWVNECPLFGLRGLNLRRQRSSLDTTIDVPLSDGENILEVSVSNVNGIESYRKPLYVSYTPKQATRPRVYFIGIGIDSFARPGHNLQWSAADIRNLSHSLGRKFGPAFHKRLLLNSQVTTQNVVALKQWLADSTAINDKVIVAYSGHGLLSDSFDYFLSTYATDFEHPEKAGLPYDVLESLLDGIPARKKLLLIDACHSGEVDKEELKRYEDNQAALAARGISRGADLVSYDTTGAHLGMKNTFELMQQLFVNVGRSTGATVISAAGGTQYAQEQGSLKSGVFTYAILEKLREGQGGVKVSELRDYVGRRVTELTNGLQVPTTRSEATNADWEVW